MDDRSQGRANEETGPGADGGAVTGNANSPELLRRRRGARGGIALTAVAIAVVAGLTTTVSGFWPDWLNLSSRAKPVFFDRTLEAQNRSPETAQTVDELVNLIMEIQKAEQTTGFAARVNRLKYRNRVSDDLLDMPLDSSERQLVLVAKIDALTRLTETRDLYSREELLELLPKVLYDFDPLVRRQAEIADAVIKTIDFMRVTGQDRDRPNQAIDRLLANYPDDVEVANYLQAINIQLISENQTEFATELMRRMQATYQPSRNATLRTLAEKIPDRIRMAQVRFDLVLQEMSYSIPAFERFISTVLLLTSGDVMGTELAAHTLWAARFCEKAGKYSEASEIYQAIERNFTQKLDSPLAISAHRAALAGKNRIESLGNPLQLCGVTQDGIQVGELAQNRPAVIVFWSRQNQDQYQDELRAIEGQVRGIKLDRVAVLGYCIDAPESAPTATSDPASTNNGSEFSPPWQAKVQQDAEQFRKMVAEIGVPDSPYVIVRRPDGVISAINVPPLEMRGVLASLDRGDRRN